MKLTTLFPTYFPDLLWWQKAFCADLIVLLDDQPVPRLGRINRCWIKSVDGPIHLTVPVHRNGKSISSLQIDSTKTWRRSHLAGLETCYRNAPFFEHYFPDFVSFWSKEWAQMLEVAFAGLEMISRFLRLERKWLLHSRYPTKGTREERVLQLLERFGCDTYVIEEGHQSYFESSQLVCRGFQVEVISPNRHPYEQQFGDFVAGLSIIDALFNEGPYTLHLMEGRKFPGFLKAK